MSSESKEVRIDINFGRLKQILRLADTSGKYEELGGFIQTTIAIIILGLLSFIIRVIVFVIFGFE